MADIDIEEVIRRVTGRVDFRELIARAAGVANALSVGAGPLIAGTLMETGLREALCLKKGELVNIPKDFS